MTYPAARKSRRVIGAGTMLALCVLGAGQT